MANGNLTVGQAIGLQSVPTAPIQAQRERARRREADEQARRKQEEKDFDILLADLKVDPSKYHRIDRDRASTLARDAYQKVYDLYSKRNPNWRNEAAQILYDYKFADNQIQVDSKNKFQYEKDYSDPTAVHDNTGTAYYNWLQSGTFNQPPPIAPDQFGEITAFDPMTGTVGYRRGKQYNLPKYADQSIFDPALSGYQVDPKSGRYVGKDQFFRENAQYDPTMVEGGIYASAGGPEFQGWSIQNADRIRAAATANPNTDPAEVMMDLWKQDIMALKPNKFKEVRVSPPAQTNINNYTGSGGATTTPLLYDNKQINIEGGVTELPLAGMFSQTKSGPSMATAVKGYTDDFDVNITNTPEFFVGAGNKMKGAGTTKIRATDIGVFPVFTKNLSPEEKIKYGLSAYTNTQGVIIPQEAIDAHPELLKDAGEYKVYFVGSTIPATKTAPRVPSLNAEEPTEEKGEIIYGPAEKLMANARYTEESKDKRGIHIQVNSELNQIATELNKELRGGGKPEPQKEAKKEIKRSEIAAKAAAAGYTEKEYIKLLEQKGVKIVE